MARGQVTRPAARFHASIAAGLLAAACAGQPPSSNHGARPPFDLAATRRIIEQQNDRFTKAHIAGDSATIDAMFTEDARSLPPGADAAIGPVALHALTMEYLKAGITEFREETTDFYGNEELVVDQGTYVLTYGVTHTIERGKYLNVWKREGDAWKLRTNIWNTDAAAP